jgi:hypothetical protein
VPVETGLRYQHADLQIDHRSLFNHRGRGGAQLQGIAGFRLPAFDCRLSIAGFRLQVVDFQISDFRSQFSDLAR